MNKQRHGKSQTYIGPALLQYISNVQMINVFLKCNLLFCPNHQEIHKKKLAAFSKVLLLFTLLNAWLIVVL